jgi:hypothetical protein
LTPGKVWAAAEAANASERRRSGRRIELLGYKDEAG